MTPAKELIELFNSAPDFPALTPELVRSLYRTLNLINPHTAKGGICTIPLLSVNELILLKAIFPLWPEYSGNQDYPIKSPAYFGLSPVEAYYFFSKTSSMWHRESLYGTARRRLYDFCLSMLKELLQYYRDVGTYTLQSSK